MGQLIGQAQSKGLIADAEELKTMDAAKKRQILAQATIESVTAIQIQARRKKKEKLAAKEAEAQAQDEKVEGEDVDMELEQLVYLADFPQTLEDVHALI